MTLLARVAAGDMAMIAAIYDHYGSAISSLALHRLESDTLAALVVEELFVVLWRRAHTHAALNALLGAWLLHQTQTQILVLQQ